MLRSIHNIYGCTLDLRRWIVDRKVENLPWTHQVVIFHYKWWFSCCFLMAKMGPHFSLDGMAQRYEKWLWGWATTILQGLIIIPMKIWIPSGTHTKNDGKAPFFMGKSSITWLCSIAMLVYQKVILWSCFSPIFRHTMIHRAMGWNMSKPWKKTGKHQNRYCKMNGSSSTQVQWHQSLNPLNPSPIIG